MTLDFSDFFFNLLGFTLSVAAVNLEFQSTDGTCFSDVVDYPFTEFMIINSPTVTNYFRGMDYAEFDVAGLPANLNWAILAYADFDGSLHLANMVAGHNTITGLHPLALWRLLGFLVQNGIDGTTYFTLPEIGDTLSALPTVPTIDTINVLIYQTIKQDTIFQALTGADALDPRIYLEFPPEKIKCDINKPGWATYGLHGGSAPDPTSRVLLTEMPSRTYQIDVWGRT
jgi:hypothetical protein